MKLTILKLAFIFLIGATSAQANCKGKDLFLGSNPNLQNTIRTAGAKHPFSRGRYWEAVKNGKTTLLIGTYHAPPAMIGKVPDLLMARVAKADLLLVEVDDNETAAMQREMSAKNSMFYKKNGPSNRSYFTASEWQKITTYLGKQNVPEYAIAQMQPWFLQTLFWTPECMNKRKDYGQTLDGSIENVARKNGVPIAALETYKEGMAALKKSTTKEVVMMIRNFFEYPTDEGDEQATRIGFYQRGEIWTGWEYGWGTNGQPKPRMVRRMQRKSERALLTVRNRKWRKKVLAATKKGNAVIAVGALHMGGKYGLLLMLQRRGYTIRRLGY